MNLKRYMLGSLVVFLVIFASEWLFHGVIMKSAYDAHLDLLRPQAEAGSYMPYMALGFLILAFGFSYIFVKGYEGRGVGEGVRFGLYAGIAFGVSTNLINFTVFPLPGSWVAAWCVGETIILMLAGAVLSAVYKPAL